VNETLPQGVASDKLRAEVQDILDRPMKTLMERTHIHTQSQFSEHDRFGAADTVRSRLEKALYLPASNFENQAKTLMDLFKAYNELERVAKNRGSLQSDVVHKTEVVRRRMNACREAGVK